ncbi:MAG: tetratricopeptide repeat protein [Candidatus Latescibacterota bacterium]
MRSYCPLLIVLAISLALAAPAAGQEEFDFAKSLYKDGMYGAAARQFEQFVRDHPESERAPEAQFLAAGAHFQSGALSEALSGYERFIVRNPDDLRIPEAQMNRGISLTGLGRFSDAAEVFTDLEKLFPTGDFADRALLEAGRNLRRIGDLKRASEALGAMIRDYPQSKRLSEARYLLGVCLKDQGRLDEALTQLEQAASVRSGFDQKADALGAMGRIYLSKGDIAAAQAMFQRLKEVFGDRAVTAQFAVELGNNLSEKGRFEEAGPLFEQAIAYASSADSTRASARLGWGHSEHRMGRDAAAAGHYRAFLSQYSTDSRCAEALSGLVDALLTMGQESDAVSASEKLFGRYPESEQTLTTLGRMGDFYAKRDDPLPAVSLYRRYLSFSENKEGGEVEAAQFSLAGVYEKLGWHDQAVAVYRDLLARNTRDSDRAQFALASLLEREGKIGDAVRAYASVIGRFPESSYVSQAAVAMELLRDFGSPDYPEATGRLFRIASDALAKGSPEGETLYQLGLVQFEAMKDFQEAARLFSESLAAADTVRAPDAGYQLAQSYGRLARRSALTGDPEGAVAFRGKMARTYRWLTERYPKSLHADDAALFLIEEIFSQVETDSEQCAGMLRAYEQFLGVYPLSDRMDFVLFRIGEAYRGLARTDSTSVDRAIGWYEKLATQFPESPYLDDARFGEGLVWTAAGDLSAAEAAFEKLLSEYPRSDLSALAHLRLAEIHMEREAFDQAVTALEAYSESRANSISLPPSMSPIRNPRSSIPDQRAVGALMAEATYRQGAFSIAIPLCEQQLGTEADPASRAKILLRLVEMYEQVGGTDRAIERASQCIAAYPRSEEAVSCLLTRADLFRRTERPEEALEDYRALSSSRFATRALKSRADLLFELERYEQAAKAYNTLLSASKEDADAAGNHVLCLYRLGRIQEATGAAKSFRKTFGNLRNWLARLELEQGKRLLERKEFEAAQSSFEQQLKSFGDTEYADDARYYLGLVHFQQKRMEEALKLFSDFRNAYPDSPYLTEVTMKLGTIYYLSGQFASAIDYYKAVSENTTPEMEADALFNMVLSYERLGRYEAAIQSAQVLVARFPENETIPRVKMKIGLSLMKLGDYEEAIAVFQKNMPAADAETKAALRFYVGQCRAMAGNYEEAVIEYLKVAYLHRSEAMWAVTAEYEAGKAYEKLNRLSEAENVYQRIKARYGSESEWAQAAEKRLKALHPEPSPNP